MPSAVVESLGKTLFGDRHDLEPRPRLCGVKNLLTRYSKRVGEDGAQALVALHQVAERGFKGGVVESPLEAQRNRHVVGRARPFQAVEEPQPALRKRQRDLGRAWQRNKGRPQRLADIETLDQGLDGGGFEQAADRNLDTERGADAADQPGRQQRVAAEREEVVVDADPLQPQRLGKQRAQDVLLRGARRRAARWA